MDSTLTPKVLLQAFSAAPHRMMFFIGAANVLLAMAWWTLWLANARYGLFDMLQPTAPAGWMHAIVMQYQVLPPFMFGFLLTVFPRWMNLPWLTRRHYIPVGAGLFGGQLLTLLGLLAMPRLLHAGIVLTIVGWALGLFWLVRLLFRESGRTWHAVSCAVALAFGLLGLVLFAIYLHHLDFRFAIAAIKLGGFALLLPVYFTVCHRMVPFFASVVIPGYSAPRPLWALALFWALSLAHLGMELVALHAWSWLVDLPMAALTAWLLWMWWPRSTQGPAILRVLFLGLAWLPIAFLLYAGQSAWFALTGDFVLGRAPAHALFVGFFGSLLVAMVTRVTQGHSGRPMQLGRVAGFAFIAIQLVTITRLVVEVMPDALAWQVAAGAGWLVAFLPWVLRSAWIYLTPRRDGKQG
ncbi:MAG TPA: NnrS family protein [Gammaproteobacteria bacterium]